MPPVLGTLGPLRMSPPQRHHHSFLTEAWWFLVLAGLAAAAAAAEATPPPRADLSLGHLQKPSSPALPGPDLARYSAAVLLEREGRIEEALAHYKAVLRADPSQASLAQHVASLAMQHSEAASALQILKDLVAAKPELPSSHLALAKFLTTYFAEDPFQKGEPARILSSALTRFPDSAEVYQAAIADALRLNQRDSAIALLAKARSRPVKDSSYWLTLGRVAQEIFPLAHPSLREVHRAEVNPFFAKALSLATSDTSVLHAVSQYYVVSNQLVDATQVTEQLLKLHRTPATLKLLARLYESADREEDGAKLLEEYLAMEPDDAEIHRQLASYYVEHRAFTTAVPHLDALVRLGGGRAQDYLSLGFVLLQCNERDRALQISQRALTLFPNNAQFVLLHADCLRMAGRLREALTDYEKAETLGKAMQAELLDASFYSTWADMLQTDKRYDEAGKKYQRAISLVPESEPQRAAGILNNLGYMWLELGRNLDQAGDFIARAVKLDPENPIYLDSLGWFHHLQGRYDEALRHLLRTEELMVQDKQADAEVLGHIAATLEKLGQKPRALDYAKRALTLDPSNPSLQQSVQRLQRVP
jgi:tetratricopeptide (TPR) repeat protein